MNFKNIPVKTTGVFVAALVLFTYATVKKNPRTFENSSTWKQYGSGPDQSKYFEGSQITKENVNQLKVAWVYPYRQWPKSFQPNCSGYDHVHDG